MISIVPKPIAEPLLRLYDTVPFLDALVDLVIGAFGAVGGSSFTATVTGVLVAGLLVCVLGWLFVRVLTAALPILVWGLVMLVGLGAIVWILVSPGASTGILGALLSVLSWVGLLSIAGVLAAGVDLSSAAGSAWDSSSYSQSSEGKR